MSGPCTKGLTSNCRRQSLLAPAAVVYASGGGFNANSLKSSSSPTLQFSVKIGQEMPNGAPVDINEWVHGDPDEEIQLEFVGDTRPEGGNPEFSKKSDKEIDQEVTRFKEIAKNVSLKDGGAKVQKRLKALADEQRHRRRNKRKQPDQTDCRDSKTQAIAGEARKEDIEIFNLTDDAGRLRQSASNAPVCNGDGEGQKARVWSHRQAGPSQHLGLHSASDYFNTGQLTGRWVLDRLGRECDPPKTELQGSSGSSIKEVQETNTSCGGAVGKKAPPPPPEEPQNSGLFMTEVLDRKLDKLLAATEKIAVDMMEMENRVLNRFENIVKTEHDSIATKIISLQTLVDEQGKMIRNGNHKTVGSVNFKAEVEFSPSLKNTITAAETHDYATEP